MDGDFKVGDRVVTPKGNTGFVVGVYTNGCYVKFDTWRSRSGSDTYFYDSGYGLKLETVSEEKPEVTEDDFMDSLRSLVLEMIDLFATQEYKPPVNTRAVTRPPVSPGAITVLRHLKSRGSISPVEAFSSYGTLRLAARIYELREAGHSIKTEIREDAAGHRYARYALV